MTPQEETKTVNKFRQQLSHITGKRVHIWVSKKLLKPAVEPSFILNTVSYYFQINTAEITGDSRRRKFARARRFAAYLLRQHTNFSLKQTGKVMGNRHHSTIVYMLEKFTVSDRMTMLYRDIEKAIIQQIEKQKNHD